MELLKVSKDKRALKFLKRRVSKIYIVYVIVTLYHRCTCDTFIWFRMKAGSRLS
jgi:Ribosomal protein L36e.